MKRGKFLAALLGIAGVGMLALGMSSTNASAQVYGAPACAAGYYYGPGQTEDTLQPSANDRIGQTITSGSGFESVRGTCSTLASWLVRLTTTSRPLTKPGVT